MRSLLALFAVVLLSVGAPACGGASKSTGSTSESSSGGASGSTSSGTTSTATPAGIYSKRDGDYDNDDESRGNKSAENDNTALLASYGSDVSEADKQAVTALIKTYYRAATAEDGAKACSLLTSSLAAGVGEAHGQSAKAGKSCASMVAALFKQQHQQLLADDVATMGVTEVRAKGNLGLAVLGFKRMPEGEVLIERDGGVWKIDSLLGSDMT